MSIWETIKIILSILPAIIQVVKQLEGLFPESGQGQMKLQLVIKSLEQVTGFSTELAPIVEKIISAVVAVFNSFGVFKKAE
jgi:hypothetical protein